MTNAVIDDAVQPVTVRFPQSLLDRIDNALPVTKRSRNAEIVFRLQSSLAADESSVGSAGGDGNVSRAG